LVAEVVKERLREQYRTLDPVGLLAEIRAAQEELGHHIDRRAGGALQNADHGVDCCALSAPPGRVCMEPDPDAWSHGV